MDNFSNLMMIGECLLDNERTQVFRKAITETVKSSDIVLDAGTGSGIMAMFAAKAGAKKVIAVDIDDSITKITKQNVEKNGFADIIKVIAGDLKKIKLPTKVDVLIMEMMDTGLIAEQQVPATNMLLMNGTIDMHTKQIPYKCETYAEFVDYDFSFFDYGFEMPMIVQARNSGALQHVKYTFSDKVLIYETDLTKVNELEVNAKVTFNPTANGKVNALLLKTRTLLSPNVATWETSDMNMPIIIPIENKMLSTTKETSFEFGCILGYGYQSVRFNWL